MIEEGKKYRLASDVFSAVGKRDDKKLPIAKRNELVTVIADHVNVAIVENKKGERFTVNQEEIIES